MHNQIDSSRRPTIRGRVYRAGILLLAMMVMAACSSPSTGPVATQSNTQADPTSTAALAVAQATSADPTAAQSGEPLPGCTSPASLTPALTEGPYFKANSPERASLLETGMAGTQLTLTGYVLTSDCQPVANALLDFWQADANGQYDNSGYTLRGHQYTDENGRYELITVVPGEYPGRTEHIHFKVQAPDGPVLTSQLFFPGVQDNQADQIFDSSLVINITQDNATNLQAAYNFIVTP